MIWGLGCRLGIVGLGGILLIWRQAQLGWAMQALGRLVPTQAAAMPTGTQAIMVPVFHNGLVDAGVHSRLCSLHQYHAGAAIASGFIHELVNTMSQRTLALGAFKLKVYFRPQSDVPQP